MVSEKRERILEQYKLGNTAKKALLYFSEYLEKQKLKIQKELLECKPENVLMVREKLRFIADFEKQIMCDIQTGELADMEAGEDDD